MHNLKKLLEQRSALIEKMDGMLAKLDEGEETRAFTDEELAEFNEAKSQVKSLTDTINAAEEQRGMEVFKPADGENSEADAEKRALDEIRSFEKFLRSNGAAQMETRSDTNWTTTANGAVLPTTIANTIIDKVKDISPLFSLATHYNIGGTLNIPYYDESTSEITVAYADEFNEWCFDGEPHGSAVAISTVGVERDKSAFEFFVSGYQEMITRLQPSEILVYGKRFDFMTEDNITVVEPFFKQMKERVKNGRQREFKRG